MKKAIVLILTLAMLVVACLPASAAAQSAFKQIDTYDGMPMMDNSPSNEKALYYSDEFGIGNTGIGDWVMFADVDFGATGAKEVSLMYTFMVTDYSDFPCTLEIYLDDPDEGEPVGSVTVDEDCGHWMRDAAMWFKGACDVPAGVHDVYVKWKDNTGSLFAIKFVAKEGGAAPATTTTTTKATTAATTAATTKATTAATTAATTEATTEATDEVVTTTTEAENTTVAEESTEGTTVAEESTEEASETVTDPGEDDSKPSILPIVLAVAAVVVVAIVVVVIVASKKKA